MSFLRRPLSPSNALALVLALVSLMFALSFGTGLVGCGRSTFDDTESETGADGGPDGGFDTGFDTCGSFGCPDTILPDVPPDGPRTLVAINIEPASITAPIGSVTTVIARGFYSDGTSSDVTFTATWSSDNPSVATVPKPGAVIGNAPGTARIRATMTSSVGPVIGEADVIVPKAPVTDLRVDPSSATLPVGGTQRFVATAFFADGSKADVSTSATWSILGGPPIAKVDSTGLLTALSPGGVVVQAAFAGRTAAAKVSISGKTVSRVEISPFAPTVAVGSLTAFTATAIFTDGSKADVTTTSTWSSTSPDVLSIVPSGATAGQGTALKGGTSGISATFLGVTGTTTVVVSSSPMTGLAVSPTSATISPGGTVTLKATANFADGTSSDVTGSAIWNTSDGSVATVSAGLVTGAGVGPATITASFGGFSGTSAITVSPAKLLSLTCSPNPITVPLGVTGNLKATGTYDGGVTRDVTTDVAWTTDDATISTVDTKGIVTAASVGSTSAHATLDGIVGTCSVVVTKATVASITIAPNPLSLVVGTKQFATAAAKLTDGTTLDVSTTCTWASANDKVATVSNGPGAQGQVAATGAGTTSISCTLSGVTGSATVNVSGATVEQVTVTPIAPTCVIGDMLQFFATAISTGGTSTNVTFAAAWSSDAPSIVQPTGAPGRFRCLAAGTANVSATYSGKTGSTPVTVSGATVTSVQVDPAGITMPVGDNQQYQATAFFSDGTSTNVTFASTWLSTAPSVASIATGGGAVGRARALKAGSTTIQATYKGVTGSTPLTVSGATVVSLQINPPTATVAVGTPVQFSAQAIFSDGTSMDVTGAATWLSTDTTVAQVSDAAGTKGRTTTFKAGGTTIQATYRGVTGTATLSVSSATLTTIQITPFRPTIPVGFGERLIATGLYSDGSKADLTGLATWTSTNAAVAAVSDAVGSKGRVTTSAAGLATIKATWAGVTGTDDVTVSSATLASIAITPNPATVAVSGNAALTATGTFSDGTTLDVTNRVTWTSSDTSVADVSNAGDTTGFIYGFKAGTVTVTAQRGGISGTATANVGP